MGSQNIQECLVYGTKVNQFVVNIDLQLQHYSISNPNFSGTPYDSCYNKILEIIIDAKASRALYLINIFIFQSDILLYI